MFVAARAVVGLGQALGGESTSATSDAPSRESSVPGQLARETVIFLSEQAMSDGLAIIDKAPGNVTAVAPYIACIGQPGTDYVVLDRGILRSRVQLTSGNQQGCVGWTASELVR